MAEVTIHLKAGHKDITRDVKNVIFGDGWVYIYDKPQRSEMERWQLVLNEERLKEYGSYLGRFNPTDEEIHAFKQLNPRLIMSIPVHNILYCTYTYESEQ